MYKDYININGTTIASDKKGMHQIETTDKIGQELDLENEIELSINGLNREKRKLGTIEGNKKNKKWDYIMGASVLLFVILMCKNIHILFGIPDIKVPNALFSFIHTYSDALLFTMIPITLLILVPILSISILRINSNIKEVLTIEEQLEFLTNELSKKREELEILKRSSQKVNITETSIYSIDNSKYRASLQERLNLLKYIIKYRKTLVQHFENGTLKDEFMRLKISPENIELAKNVLSRTLEKEKSY